MSEKIIDISELKPDDKNFNKHTEFGMSLLEKSVSKFGMGRSILIDKDNKIIAGNGVAETAGSVGIDRVRVIETDGNEIIAVKRTDVSLDSEQGREMALADNATNAANLQWNFKEIEKEMGAKAAEWGVENNVREKFSKAVLDEGQEQIDFPITILQNKEEYESFVNIAKRLNANNIDTFTHILNFYIKNNDNDI